MTATTADGMPRSLGQCAIMRVGYILYWAMPSIPKPMRFDDLRLCRQWGDFRPSKGDV